MSYPYQTKTGNIRFTLSRYKFGYKIVAVNPDYEDLHRLELLKIGLRGPTGIPGACGITGPRGVQGHIGPGGPPPNPLIFAFELNDYMDKEGSLNIPALKMVYPELDFAKILLNFKYIKSKMMKMERFSYIFS